VTDEALEAERYFATERGGRAPGRPTGAEWFELVAVHWAARVTRPLKELRAACATLAAALPEGEEAAVRAGAAELPRLQRLGRALNAGALEGRPTRALYREDRAAYAAAMRSWELGRPRVDAVVEARFLVTEVSEGLLGLRAPTGPLELPVTRQAQRAARVGDGLNAAIGLSRGEPTLVQCFSVVAARRS